jgi:hypothetical protein
MAETGNRPCFGALAVDESLDAAGEVVKVTNRINFLAALQVGSHLLRSPANAEALAESILCWALANGPAPNEGSAASPARYPAPAEWLPGDERQVDGTQEGRHSGRPPSTLRRSSSGPRRFIRDPRRCLPPAPAFGTVSNIFRRSDVAMANALPTAIGPSVHC